MLKILFICTHNRCRSIVAEAMCNHLGHGRLIAQSAGSQAAEQVHPLSLQHLRQRGIDTTGLYSKSWDTLEAFAPDIVITVCDSAASEQCPVWFGKAIKVHWGLSDPSTAAGDASAVAAAFEQLLNKLEQRLSYLLTLDLESLSDADLKQVFEHVAERY